MCGIVGLFHFDPTRPVEADRVVRMRDRLAHRGPDDAGLWIAGNVALGHRRLAIIDTTHGHQPMAVDADLRLNSSPNHSESLAGADQSHAMISLSFNGEIYNYLELREELRAKGYRFETESDTEVLLKAYAEWGTNCVQHFNGVWAFALYDSRTDTLFCSRDRLGEKPLYYAVYDNSLLIASEIKALFAYGLPKEWNPELLDIYLSLNYIPAPYSFFRNISKLEPGTNLMATRNGIRCEKYWQLPMVEEHDKLGDEASALRTVDELLHDSVRLRLRSDVPVGAFLSGGLDSSSVVRIASELNEQALLSFTAGFDNPEVDERSLAEQVARHCHTDHRSFAIHLEHADTLIPELIDVYDEPFGDASALATYVIAREASKQVRVILTGDGGDEALVGYTIHQGEKLNSLLSALPGLIRARFAPTVVQALQHTLPARYHRSLSRLIDVLRATGLSFPDRLIAKQIGFSATDRTELLRESQAIPVRDFVQQRLSPVASTSTLNQLHYWLTTVSLPDDMLTKVDRATMAHALEARLPFLDHRLVEYLWQVRMDVRLKGMKRKYLLRRLMHDSLPADLFKAPKKGFVLPLNDWLADRHSSLRRTIERAADSGLVNRDALRGILQRHDDGAQNSANALWGVAMLASGMARQAETKTKDIRNQPTEVHTQHTSTQSQTFQEIAS